MVSAPTISHQPVHREAVVWMQALAMDVFSGRVQAAAGGSLSGSSIKMPYISNFRHRYHGDAAEACTA